MYYPSGNSNNNSSFNNQPTQFGNYPPPPPPGQFGYPSQAPQKKSIGDWFKGQKKGTQIGIGCGIVFLVLTLCTCSLTAIAGSHSSSGQTALSDNQTAGGTTITQTKTAITTSVPTHTLTPTAIPTLSPTSTTIPPTPIPTRPPVPTPTPIPTHPPVPTEVPTQPPAPTPTPATTGVNGNPWGYDFSPGNLIYSPPTDFCTYFNCIPSFWQSTNGYVDECQDGTYSHSGGRSGACSHHGGEMRPLYSH